MRWLQQLTKQEQALLVRQTAPQWCAPMLATLTQKRFSDPEWIYECKLDGVRALAFRDGSSLRLLTRNGNDLGANYPSIVAALTQQRVQDFVVDGEIVAFQKGVTSFSRLQQRMHLTGETAQRSHVAVYYYLFDILHLDGFALDQLTLRTRKKILKSELDYGHRLRFSNHRNTEGEAYFQLAREKGWEGIIAKRAASQYQHKRSTDWLKFKCAKRQELVIGGYTEPQRGRKGFGALLVGYYDKGRLHYAGRVGTGFDDALLVDLRRRLEKLGRESSPFADAQDQVDAHWVNPLLVGEIQFTEWTKNGKLRHPSFLGLREDKDPTDVVREET